MTFEELRQKLQNLDLKELRFDLEDYLEFVVQAQCMDQVKIILDLYFGHEVNIHDLSTAKEAVEFVEKWGGIRSNQTLYYSSRDGSTEYAMLWPWCDGNRISVKVAQCRSYRQ